MKNHLPPYLIRSVLAAFALGLPTVAKASVTAYLQSNIPSMLVTSTGAPLDGTFSFELGTFQSGFTPTWGNFEQWNSNWNTIARAFDPTPADPNDGDPNGWNPLDQFFGLTVVFENTGISNGEGASATHAFIPGEQVYLWVYNSKTQEPGTEWALVTNVGGTGDTTTDWVVPVMDELLPSTTWDLEDTNAAIVGGANNVRGGGSFTVLPANYDIQTAVVPEPGTAGLLVLTCLPLLRRRRQKSR